MNAEIADVWIAADIAGAVPLPDADVRRGAVVEQLVFMDIVTNTHHWRGTKITPFSMKNVDEVLGDLDLDSKARVWASHWLNPISPSAYQGVTPVLPAKLASAVPAPEARVLRFSPAAEESERNVAG